MKIGDFVRVSAPWSQIQGKCGVIVDLEEEDVRVTRGHPPIAYRLHRTEVQPVEAIPFDEFTVGLALVLQQVGTEAVVDGDRRAVVLTR